MVKTKASDPAAREIGARVREVREGRALTQQEVARRAGLAMDAMSRIENGYRKPRPSTLQRLATALDVAVERLTGATELGTRGLVLSSPPREGQNEGAPSGAGEGPAGESAGR